MLKGLETLPLRVRAQCETARPGSPTTWPPSRASRACCSAAARTIPQAALAKRQMSGFGQVVTFEIDGGKAAAFRFLNALRLVKISNNLGDAKSLITHPATTTHQRLKPEARAELGISDGMLRLSVGLEALRATSPPTLTARWPPLRSADDPRSCRTSRQSAARQPRLGHIRQARALPPCTKPSPEGIRVRVTPQYLEEESSPDEGPLLLGLHHRHHQRGQRDGAAALAALAHHRRRRPHRGGARARRGGRDAGAGARRVVPLHLGLSARPRRRASWSAPTR